MCLCQRSAQYPPHYRDLQNVAIFDSASGVKYIMTGSKKEVLREIFRDGNVDSPVVCGKSLVMKLLVIRLGRYVERGAMVFTLFTVDAGLGGSNTGATECHARIRLRLYATRWGLSVNS